MARQARRLIAAVAVMAIATSASAKYQPTAADLLRKIDRLGPREVLQQDFNLNGGPGYATVEAGSADGVAVAVKLLKTVADAAFSEGLQSSLGIALQRHPENVLPLVGTASVLGAEKICLPQMIEVSRRHARLVLARTRLALNQPAARAFPEQRAACLAQVQQLQR